ncbi:MULTISPECIES: glutamate decarboxylase [unclassified Saccharopolyspora]|uniref:glutamate decarboxylase n=1 Tax=Saccharopolyspora TaxID=1835 RepID=UPI001909A526|nr:glutamate decarboxylase [Saccharopolyspora sp. HNM0986]MBK0866730.1 glutamate decarboxylase [Saccharopolyspora sp. HNM0986]
MSCPQAASRASAPPTTTARAPGVLPAQGWTASAAANAVRIKLRDDIRPAANLATFLTSTVEPEAEKLFSDYLTYNIIDRDQYPGATELERNCVHTLANLWHADPAEAVGTATTGSSEAALLAGAALLRRWRQRVGEGRRPNLVLGANAHVCWYKFCRYWDVEPRFAPAGQDRLHLTAEQVRERCDADTIGVLTVLGSTIDGSYEPVGEIAAALDEVQAETGLDVPIHVDAASGGFVAPFLDPQLQWDFRLPRVRSVNTSGHKYGLVPAGLGWIVWRDAESRTNWLSFDTNYLGSTRANHELSFSRSAAPVVLQYYNFLRLGFEGYRAAHQRSRSTATALATAFAGMGPFRVVGDGGDLPVVVLAQREGDRGWTLRDLAAHLAGRGWSVPVYPLPPDRQETDVLRIVVRGELTERHTEDLLDSVRGYLSGAIATPA